MSLSSSFSIPLLVTRHPQAGGTAAGPEPLRIGLPIARGVYDGRAPVAVVDAEGVPQPTQARVLNRWSDGSVRWLLVDFVAAAGPDGWRGELRPVAVSAAEGSPFRVETTAAGVTVHTGAARFEFRRGGSLACVPVSLDDLPPPVDAASTVLEAREATGKRGAFVAREVMIEDQGPLRVTVRLSGSIDGLTHPLLVEARVTGFAGAAIARVDVTVRNPTAAKHPGGCWDLGDPSSLLLERLSLTLPFRAGLKPTTRCSAEADQGFGAGAQTLEIYQDSSGGEAWHSATHLNRERKIATTFRGYELREDGTTRKGLRANPLVAVAVGPDGGVGTGGDGELSAVIADFWQNFPKAIEASAQALHLHLFPPRTAGGHELQGGEQKTHTLFLAFAPQGSPTGGTASALRWARTPSFCRSTPEYYCSTGAMPYLTTAASERDAGYQQLIESAIAGAESFEEKRERLDGYGWRHYGDVYGDHEAAFHPGPTPLVSHWNNQYDTIGGAARQFLRTGDVRWWQMMVDMAAHVADIDVYHTDEDKSAYNHGLFWHTAHYVDADIATHRTYPSQARVSSGEHNYASKTKIIGGGPASGHLYATGLGLTYMLTGNEVARTAALELAQYVIDSDDGNKTVFKWLDRGYTGQASGSGWDNYHGPGRGSANALNALLDGYWLSGEARFLDKAEQLIRRCIHPTEDVTRNKLHDVENRWFYTMFLQALGRYLDVKAEAGAFDRGYRYARASLLHYARWMAAHARPFLDKPDELEFPTETWAAQDVRKVDIFLHAARHASPAERTRFLERADWFGRYVVDTLQGMPTKTLCRPVALLMGNGFMRNWFALHPDEAAPAIPEPSAQEDFGQPTVFVPQKVRAMRRAKIIVVVGAAAVLALVVAAGVALLAG